MLPASHTASRFPRFKLLVGFSHILCHLLLCNAAGAPLLLQPQLACSVEAVWDCSVSLVVQILVGLIGVAAFIWFLMWLYLTYRAKHHLNGLPYTEYKIANLFLRLQVSTAYQS